MLRVDTASIHEQEALSLRVVVGDNGGDGGGGGGGGG